MREHGVRRQARLQLLDHGPELRAMRAAVGEHLGHFDLARRHAGVQRRRDREVVLALGPVRLRRCHQGQGRGASEAGRARGRIMHIGFPLRGVCAQQLGAVASREAQGFSVPQPKSAGEGVGVVAGAHARRQFLEFRDIAAAQHDVVHFKRDAQSFHDIEHGLAASASCPAARDRRCRRSPRRCGPCDRAGGPVPSAR